MISNEKYAKLEPGIADDCDVLWPPKFTKAYQLNTPIDNNVIILSFMSFFSTL